MLSYIWVSVGGALSSAVRFWISGMPAQRCVRLFREETLAVKITGSFITGPFAALADFEGRHPNAKGND